MGQIKFENEEMKLMLEQKIKEMFSQILVYLEISFPHEKGDGTDNEKRYNIIRSKILRSGNDTIRSLSEILKSYAVLKASDCSSVKRDEEFTTLVADFKKKFGVIGRGEG